MSPARAEMSAVRLLFEAKAIALIGASPDQKKLSSSPLNALENFGYRGKIYAVNPNYRDLRGNPCVPTIAELPDGIEAACILLPAAAAVEAVEACAKKGIRAIVIVAQGFSEAGPEGLARDQRLLELTRQYGLALCGPNSNGLSNVASGLTLSFAPIFQFKGSVRPGTVSLISQSGAMSSTLLTKIAERGAGIAKSIACGNELVLGVAEYLDFLAEDPGTDVVVLFLETIRDTALLAASMEKCQRNNKPIVAMKIGSSPSGQKATLSHTGAIAGSYRNTLAFLRKHGALIAEDMETLAALAECLLRDRWPLPAPPKPCVISVSGGFAAMAADDMAKAGLELPDPSPIAAHELSQLPTQSHPVNPYDIAAQNAVITPAIDIFERDGFNQLIFGLALLKDGIREHVLQLIIDAKKKGFPQIYVVTPQIRPEEAQLFYDHGITVTTDLIPLLRAMRILRDHYAALPEQGGAQPSANLPVVPQISGMMDEAHSKSLIAGLGIRSPRAVVLEDELDLVALSALSRPLVMKGLSEKIAHKSEHGLVALGLNNDADINRAYADVSAALAKADPFSTRILVEEMIGGGLEAILGLQRDKIVGPVIAVGAGGILVELLDDAVVLVPPFSLAEVRRELTKTRFGRMLDGYRGRYFDIDALCTAAVALGQLALAEPRLDSVDINPLLVQPAGAGVIALDAKVFLADS